MRTCVCMHPPHCHKRSTHVTPCVHGHTLRMCVWSHLAPPQDWSAADKAKGVQRYLVGGARVSQAQQQKELHPGTEAGLAAVTRELFMTSEVRPGGGLSWGGGGGSFHFTRVARRGGPRSTGTLHLHMCTLSAEERVRWRPHPLPGL